MSTARFDLAGRLEGEVRPPADKSISHRAAIFGAMADAPVAVRNYLVAADTTSSLNAVRALGASVEGGNGADGPITIRGVGLRGTRAPDAAIDGTVARLQAARAALAGGDRDALEAWQVEAAGDREALLEAGLTGGAVHELRAVVPNRPGVIADIALTLGREGINISDMALTPSPDFTRGEIALWVGEAEAARAEALLVGLGLSVNA